MIAYDASFEPPAPVLQITVINVLQRRRRVATSALVDTGSDITAIPASLFDALDLYPISRLQLEDVSARTQIVSSYAVALDVAGIAFPRMEIILTALDHAVLGRDVLNLLHLDLNGPALTFEISAGLGRV